MNLVLRIPDDLADRLRAGGDIERQALEALALESYRSGRLTKPELRRLLGFDTRMQLDEFLKAHNVFESYTLAEFDREQEDLQRLGF
ncbi:MAG TPA: UPF0175 family protein [Stellaceae bacterium]|nr:UPF0175 family protein [Stellaceae bacterium]